jgi:glutathione S-transferase
VRWLLGELGAPYELAVVTQAEQASAAHRRRHPLARVPVLDDGEGLVSESAAICLHLADLHPEARLLPPPGSHGRALVYQWAFFAMTELEAPLADVSYGTPSGDGRGGDVHYPQPTPEQVAAATAPFGAAARVVEDALGDGDYLVAQRFGVADLLVGSVLAWADDVGLLDRDYPRLTTYLTALRARPAYAY